MIQDPIPTLVFKMDAYTPLLTYNGYKEQECPIAVGSKMV